MHDINIITKFLLWITGIDSTLIKACPKSETIRYSALGFVTLVPAILSFISMHYLLSLYVSLSNEMLLLFSFLWGFIILSIDRILMMGLSASKVKIIPIFFRFLISIVLGLFISHPLVILMFEDEIKTHIEKEASVDNIYNKKIDYLYDEINIVENKMQIQFKMRESYRALSNHEREGRLKCIKIYITKTEFRKPCSSGKGDCGQLCLEFKKFAKEADSEYIRLLKKLNTTNKKLEEKEKEKHIESKNDLSVKTRALWKILNTVNDPLFLIEVIGLFLLLMIIDIIPILIKSLSKESLYDKLIIELEKKWDYNHYIHLYDTFQQLNFEKIIELKTNKINNVKSGIINNTRNEEMTTDTSILNKLKKGIKQTIEWVAICLLLVLIVTYFASGKEGIYQIIAIIQPILDILETIKGVR